MTENKALPGHPDDLADPEHEDADFTGDPIPDDLDDDLSDVAPDESEPPL